MTDRNVKVSITIVDQTKEALDSVKKNIQGFKEEISNTTSVIKDKQLSLGKLVTAIGLGTAAYDLAKKAIGTFTGFLRGSIEEAIQAEKQMALARAELNSMGEQYDALLPKIKVYADEVVNLGFDNEDTIRSITKLIQVTRDYDKALELNALAMDLARNKGVDLQTATQMITLVTQGSGRVLKQYGINLKENSTIAEQLTELQDKLSGSTEAYAHTVKGQIEIARVKWNNLKEAVGTGIVKAFQIAFSEGLNLNNVMINQERIVSRVTEVMSKLFAVIQAGIGGFRWVGNRIAEGIETVKSFGTALEMGVNKVAQFFSGGKDEGLKKRMQELTKDLEVSANTIKNLGDEHTRINEGISSAWDKITGKVKTGIDRTTESIRNLQVKSKETFEGIGIAIDENIGRVKDKVKNLVIDLKEVPAKINDIYRSFLDKQNELTENFRQKIKDINRDIEEENARFQKSQLEKQASFQSDAVRLYLDHKNRLEDINENLLDIDERLGELRARTQDESIQREISKLEKRRQDLEIQKQQEIDIINRYRSLETQAQIEAAKSDLDRLFEKHQLEIEEDRKAHEERLKLLQQRLSDEETEYTKHFEKLIIDTNAKFNELKATYEKKLDEIKVSVGVKTPAILNQLQIAQKQVETTINTIKSKINELNAITIIPPTIKTNTSTKGFQYGGFIPEGRTVNAILHGPEYIIPARNVNNNTGGITININNPSIKDIYDIDRIKADILNAISRSQELIQLGAIT